jgi:hypothetical protein
MQPATRPLPSADPPAALLAFPPRPLRWLFLDLSSGVMPSASGRWAGKELIAWAQKLLSDASRK